MRQSPFTLLTEIRDRTYADNELAFAFLTNIPITQGHTLIAPKRVVATIDELTPTEIVAMHALVLQVKHRLSKQLGAKGFNFAWNEGKDFGQSVPHLHVHVVPRTIGDSGITEYEPRQYLYRPGERDVSPESALSTLAALLAGDTDNRD